MRILVCIFVFLGVINAHSLKIFASENSSNLMIKSYFYGGSACKNCQVEIINNGKILAQNNTDDKGEASFTLPTQKDLIIKVHASVGHFKEMPYTLKAQNIAISENSSDEKNIFADILKGFGSVLAILAIFALLYFGKKRFTCLS